MLKLLIVDDEPIVREGLKKIINWDRLGFSLCGEGIDGRDGLNKTLELKPDLLMVDIRMPGYTGLELVERARNLGFKGKVIILSGYSDFHYAQSAIRLGVKSYLVKPIEEDELEKVVQDLYKEIISEKMLEEQVTLRMQNYEEILIKKLCLNPIGSRLMNEEVSFLKENFTQAWYHLTLISLQGCRYELHIVNMINQFLEQHNNCIALEIENNVGILFGGRSEGSIKSVLKNLEQHLKVNGISGLFYAIGKMVTDILYLNDSYTEANNIIGRQFVYTQDIIAYQPKPKMEDQPQAGFQVDELYSYIQIGDKKKINVMFEQMERYFRESDFTVDKIKGFCVQCLLEIKERLAKDYPEFKRVFASNEQIVHKVYDQKKLKLLHQYMCTVVEDISVQVGSNSPVNTMEKILSYIKKNYMKDLKLESLSKLFNYNSAYLGKLFKTHTGYFFNEYLDILRIEQAKRLLGNHNLKVYEVSERIGYRNVDYFYSKFRKYVEVSPKEYQKYLADMNQKV